MYKKAKALIASVFALFIGRIPAWMLIACLSQSSKWLLIYGRGTLDNLLVQPQHFYFSLAISKSSQERLLSHIRIFPAV